MLSFKDEIKEGENDQGEECGCGESEDNGPGKSFPDGVAHNGERTEYGRKRGEDDGEQSDATGFHERFSYRHATPLERLEVFQIDNSIFFFFSGECNDTDHGGGIEVCSFDCLQDCKSGEYADQSERDAYHDEPGYEEGFCSCRQDKKYEKQNDAHDDAEIAEHFDGEFPFTVYFNAVLLAG